MMHIQGTNLNTVVACIRLKRKCFSFNGSLLFLLLLTVVQQANAQDNHDEDVPHNLNVGEEFKDVNNQELNRIKLEDGVKQEHHPVIIYKEDLVNEDYVPPKNEGKSEKHKRGYKDIVHQRRVNKQNTSDIVIEEKPEKILFDIIPEKPIIVPEDMFKHRKSHMKLVPLIDDFSVTKELDTKESFSKSELSKLPKKFHHRVRRNANGEHVLHKRNFYFKNSPKVFGEIPAPYSVYMKYPVAGKRHNGLDIPIFGSGPLPTNGPTYNMPISFDNRVAADENDRVIFSAGRPSNKRPTESIFRDPRPENFDFSFMNPQSPPTTTTRRPLKESIFRDPRPENFDFSFMNPQRPTTTTTTRRPLKESIFRDPRPENFDFSFMNPQRPTTTTTTRRPLKESIFRDPRPENFDFSFMNPQRPTTTTTTTPRPTRESIFRDPRPENFDFSFMNQGRPQSFTTSAPALAPTRATTTAPQATAAPVISKCVWAIVQCCSLYTSEIRYSCFEMNGCYGAFWGINPCAEDVRHKVVNFVTQYY